MPEACDALCARAVLKYDMGSGGSEGTGEEVVPPPEPPPAVGGGSTQFFVARQYVAYQKEVVILSPPAVYAPNTPATNGYMAAVQPTAQQIAATEHVNPAWRNQAFSSLPQRPVMKKPAALTPKYGGAKWSAPPRAPGIARQRNWRPGPAPVKRRRRRGNWHKE